MHSATALVVIDAQRWLLDGAFDADGVVERISSLIERAREADVPVLFVQHDGEPGSDMAPGTEGWLLHPDLQPVRDELVIRKTASDSFYRTDLDEWLRDRGIRRLVVTGLRTEMCVDTTSRQAVSRGYDVTLASDAHTTDDNDVLSARQIVGHHNTTLDDFGTDEHVVTVVPAAAIEL